MVISSLLSYAGSSWWRTNSLKRVVFRACWKSCWSPTVSCSNKVLFNSVELCNQFPWHLHFCQTMQLKFSFATITSFHFLRWTVLFLVWFLYLRLSNSSFYLSSSLMQGFCYFCWCIWTSKADAIEDVSWKSQCCGSSCENFSSHCHDCIWSCLLVFFFFNQADLFF